MSPGAAWQAESSEPGASIRTAEKLELVSAAIRRRSAGQRDSSCMPPLLSRYGRAPSPHHGGFDKLAALQGISGRRDADTAHTEHVGEELVH